MNIYLKLEGILSILFVLLLIFSFDTPAMAIMTVIAAAIHEFGHIVTMSVTCGMDFSLPEGRLYGFSIKSKKNLSYKQELAILLGGPLANLFATIISLLLSPLCPRFWRLFSLVNFLTMSSNLLPINKYDGYKCLECVAAIKSRDYKSTLLILRRISFITSTFIAFFSLYLILKIGTGYWIFIIMLSEILNFMKKGKNAQKNEQ